MKKWVSTGHNGPLIAVLAVACAAVLSACAGTPPKEALAEVDGERTHADIRTVLVGMGLAARPPTAVGYDDDYPIAENHQPVKQHR